MVPLRCLPMVLLLLCAPLPSATAGEPAADLKALIDERLALDRLTPQILDSLAAVLEESDGAAVAAALAEPPTAWRDWPDVWAAAVAPLVAPQ